VLVILGENTHIEERWLGLQQIVPESIELDLEYLDLIRMVDSDCLERCAHIFTPLHTNSIQGVKHLHYMPSANLDSNLAQATREMGEIALDDSRFNVDLGTHDQAPA